MNGYILQIDGHRAPNLKDAIKCATVNNRGSHTSAINRDTLQNVQIARSRRVFSCTDDGQSKSSRAKLNCVTASSVVDSQDCLA